MTSKVNRIYETFKDLFPIQNEGVINYRAHGKNGILMYTRTGGVLKFEYNNQNNYILQKGANKYEITKHF